MPLKIKSSSMRLGVLLQISLITKTSQTTLGNMQSASMGTHSSPLKSLEDAGVGLENMYSPNMVCGHGMGNRSPCPLCHSHSYLVKRIKTAVKNGFARMDMNIKRSYTNDDYLSCLEVKDWRQACLHIVQKMDKWNSKHKLWPQRQMTILNIQTDHIRPVTLFKEREEGGKKKSRKPTPVSRNCCNHHTNLQPLLIMDNAWKGDSWGIEDEQFWLKNIILQSNYKDVYYTAGKIQPSLMEPL